MIKKSLIALAVLCSQTAVADDYFSLPGGWDKSTGTPLMLASADDGNMSMSGGASEPYQDRMITANKLHKYLGIGSIIAAGLTMIAPKPEVNANGEVDNGGAHEALADTAAGLGVGAIATGLAFHWDDITLSNSFKDPDNLHITLTTLGTLGYLAAVSEAPDSGHAGFGAGGAIAMAIGIKMVW